MRQNTELTRLINQLTEEKNTLRSIVVKLEELNRCHWHTGAGRDCVRLRVEVIQSQGRLSSFTFNHSLKISYMNLIGMRRKYI